MSIALAFVTAERPCSAQRLIRSARRFLGNIAIYVADQSMEIDGMSAFYDANRVNALRLSSQVSLSAARNALLRKISEDFVLLCEDSFVLGPCSAVDAAVTVLESLADIGVVGGRLHEIDDAGERVRIGEQYLQLDPWHRTFTTIPISHFAPAAQSVAGMDVYACDSVARFCILRRSVFLEGNQWDERIRSRGGHEDFLLNLKRNAKWRVVYLPSMAALEVRSGPEDADGWTDFLEKWEISRVLQIGPGTHEVGDVTDAHDNNTSGPQDPDDIDGALKSSGRTAPQVDAASALFELHSRSREIAVATAARRINQTSLRSLLEQATDSSAL